MYNDFEENLFGYDMRHKPPITILPTQENGWGGSHNRLAYSSMNRSQEWNYSEYAITTIGMMPKNYIIVNQKEVNVNKETALKVCHNRVAIPVKEFARQKKLTLKEQWELMNPRWIGTFFGFSGEDPYHSRRPTLEQAMSEAMEHNRLDDFMQQFWSAKYGHKKALERLEHRAKDLEERGKYLENDCLALSKRIEKVQSDMNKGLLVDYHLQGYNAHEYLRSLRAKYFKLNSRRWEYMNKAKRIKEYINSITY